MNAYVLHKNIDWRLYEDGVWICYVYLKKHDGHVNKQSSVFVLQSRNFDSDLYTFTEKIKWRWDLSLMSFYITCEKKFVMII